MHVHFADVIQNGLEIGGPLYNHLSEPMRGVRARMVCVEHPGSVKAVQRIATGLRRGNERAWIMAAPLLPLSDLESMRDVVTGVVAMPGDSLYTRIEMFRRAGFAVLPCLDAATESERNYVTPIRAQFAAVGIDCGRGVCGSLARVYFAEFPRYAYNVRSLDVLGWCRWTTVATSLWWSRAKAGEILVKSAGRVDWLPVDDAHPSLRKGGRHLDELPPVEFTAVMRFAHELGCDLDTLRVNHVERAIFNAAALQRVAAETDNPRRTFAPAPLF